MVRIVDNFLNFTFSFWIQRWASSSGRSDQAPGGRFWKNLINVFKGSSDQSIFLDSNVDQNHIQRTSRSQHNLFGNYFKRLHFPQKMYASNTRLPPSGERWVERCWRDNIFWLFLCCWRMLMKNMIFHNVMYVGEDRYSNVCLWSTLLKTFGETYFWPKGTL